MSRRCEICGKRTRTGKRVARRGLAKSKGGVGIKTTSTKNRKYYPNLQKVRAIVQGDVRRVRLCAKCLRSGNVTKPPSRRRILEALAAKDGAATGVVAGATASAAPTLAAEGSERA